MSDNPRRHLRANASNPRGFPPPPPTDTGMLPLPNGVNGPPVVPPFQQGYAANHPPAQYPPHVPNHYLQHPPPPPPPAQAPPQNTHADLHAPWSYAASNPPNANNITHAPPPPVNRSHPMNSSHYSYHATAATNTQHRAPALRSVPFVSTTTSNGNSYHASDYSNAMPSRGSTAPLRSSPRGAGVPPPTTINSFPQIRDALARHSDDSHLIGRFAQYLGEHLRLPTRSRRATILNFAGFQGSHVPKANTLCQLNKTDLDSLASALGLSTRGRKMDIANRIGGALRAPLFSKHPVPHSQQHVSLRSYNPSTPRTANTPAYGTGASHNVSTGSSLYVGNNTSRTNMPVMPPSAAYTSSHGAQRSAAPPRRRNRELIQSISQLMVPETPFNIPLSEPLGEPTHTIFTSADLNKNQEPRITFLSPNLEDFEQVAKGKGAIQVHLRCLKVEPSKDPSTWKQGWPFPAAARINNFNVDLTQAQRFTNGKLAGVDKATDITRFLRVGRDRTIYNAVALRRNANSNAAANGTFLLFAQVVLVKSASAMQDEVRENTRKYWYELRQLEVSRGMDPTATDFELSRLQVESFMNGDDGIAVASQKVSLKCPLSLVPITIPVRGKTCSHIQCFDLAAYLDYTRRSTKFACPVCNVNNAKPEDLVISPYIEYALKNYSGNDEIEVTADGTITAVENLKKGVASPDSDDEFGQPSSKRRKTGNDAAAGGSNSVVVDLTLESDDDDVAPAQPANTEVQPPVNGIVPPPVMLPQVGAIPTPSPNAAPLTSVMTTTTINSTPATVASTPNADTFIVPAPAPSPVRVQTVTQQGVGNEDWMFEGNVAPEPAVPEADVPPPAVADAEENEFDTFNHTFTAPRQGNIQYPWDMEENGENSDSDDGQTNNDGEMAENEQQSAGDTPSEPVFENGIEVICIDD